MVCGCCPPSCYGPCDSTAAACELPEFLYVNWGVNNGDPGPIAFSPYGGNQEGMRFFGTVCFDGSDCFGANPFDPEDDDPEGSPSSFSIAGVGPVVWCDGVAYITATINHYCAICLIAPGDEFTLQRALFGRERTICLRWENDEDGCPVGDAVVVLRSVFSQYYPVEPGGPLSFAVAGPRPEACGDLPGAGCECPDTCPEEDPVISFLPS